MGEWMDYVNNCLAAVHYEEVAGDEEPEMCWTCEWWEEHPKGINPGFCSLHAEWKDDDDDACPDHEEKIHEA